MRLMVHVDTEGLFRKSGSVVRLKALKVKNLKLTLQPLRLLGRREFFSIPTPVC